MKPDGQFHHFLPGRLARFLRIYSILWDEVSYSISATPQSTSAERQKRANQLLYYSYHGVLDVYA